MKTTARTALWPILERAQKAVPPDMQDRLRATLAQLGRTKVELMLRVWRPVAIDLAQAKTARERRALLDQFASNAPDFAHYAAAAWIARTLALMEYLDGFEPDIPRQWAGAHAFSLMNDFEGDETWLWPFNSESPWPDEDD